MRNVRDNSIWQVAFQPLSIARMLWKQKVPVVVVWLLITAASIGFVSRLPAIYRAETVILVDSEKIPDKFVSATVSTNLRERLDMISQQILSSSRLLQIIESFDLYPEQRRNLPIGEVMEIMRRDLQMRFEKGSIDERSGAFRVSFQGRNPTVVAQVTNQLGNLIVNGNVRNRELHAEDTLQFIQSQLEQAKKSLDEQEKRIGEYKLGHNGELPEQANALTANLNQLSAQLHGNQEAITRALSNQAALRSGLRLAQTLAGISERLNKHPEEATQTADGRTLPSAERPEDVRKALEAELEPLLKRFTEAHPRVKLLRASIARIKALEEKEQIAAAVDPEHTEGLKAQLAAADREVADRTEESRRLIQEIHVVQSRLGNIPIREQEVAALTRDYEISKDNYKSLLDKLHEADMAADMERRQKTERFTILEPARVPDRPIAPNRLLLFTWGALLAVMTGATVGLVRELKKNRILGEWELPPGTLVCGRVPSLGRRGVLKGVRLRLRTGGPLLGPVVNGLDKSSRVEGHSSWDPKAIQPEEDLTRLPLSPATGPRLTSTLGVRAARTMRTICPASPAICLDGSDLRALEQYRIARTKIEYDPRAPKLVAITSACEGDGKTISAINLAGVFAMRRDVKILLVGADFRHPSLAELLGIPPRPGVADVLSGRCELSDAIIGVEQLPNLCVLPTGTNIKNVTEMLDAPAWLSLCSSLRDQFAFTIFDTPPVGCVVDYELIEKGCDGVIMVVRPDHTDRSLFRIAHELVLPDKMLGVLVNSVDDWFLWKTPASSYEYWTSRSEGPATL